MIGDAGKANSALRNVTLDWERTFNSMSDLIFIQDKDFTIVRVNLAFAKAMNKKPEELIGLKCYQVLHKLDRPWHTCPMEKSRLDFKDHTEEVDDPNIGIPLLITTSPIFDNDGKFAGSVHIAKDISTQRKLTSDLTQRIGELERFSRVTVDRELRMKELKEKIAELEYKLKEKSGGS